MDLTPEQNDLFEKLANLAYRRNVNHDDIARLTSENQALSREMAELEAEIIENVDLSVWDVNIYHCNNAYFVHNPHAQDEKILVTFSVYPLLVRPPFNGSDDAPIPF